MDTNQIIREQLKNSPAEIQDYIKNSPWPAITEDIGEQQSFSEAQTERLKNEVLFVLLGLDLAQNLPQNMENTLGLSRERALALSGEINTLIFTRVRDFLPTEIEGSTLPDRFIQTQTTLKPAENSAPANLPTGEVAEERIIGSLGSPGEKLAWEQRKQIAANALPKAEEKRYNGVDPYREPLS